MPHCPHCGAEVEASDLQYERNSFREDADSEEQLHLDDLAESIDAEPSGDDGVWGRIEMDGDSLDDLGIRGPELAFGETLNENDPAEW